ncbi:unnamed protein product [Pleuronectes platessa]|uniref:Uncharacterized protein n=1 Tax=Pleuronectes platessa TaxID=8262 RepID=A0A9N7U551_PLEPL|nr:unnamed protein product [Pleuronectes platessa]
MKKSHTRGGGGRLKPHRKPLPLPPSHRRLAAPTPLSGSHQGGVQEKKDWETCKNVNGQEGARRARSWSCQAGTGLTVSGSPRALGTGGRKNVNPHNTTAALVTDKHPPTTSVLGLSPHPASRNTIVQVAEPRLCVGSPPAPLPL